ncbi:MAG: AMP-binding protein [Dysgonamonadaceae bacterium]|nr:AMP-binding protein [Dysgonamonadaceae bacterium]MDD4245625.1 AMP-binding protein [Dysgonamonadaceae bacterium]
MIDTNFINLYESSFRENWELNAFTDLHESTTITYGEFAKEIARLHILLEEMSITKKDKIALIGHNHTTWAALFMATITYGAVIVPILHDFHPESMENIIVHSDAKIIFIELNIWKNLNKDKFSQPVFDLRSKDLIQGETDETKNLKVRVDKKFAVKYPDGFQVSDIQYPTIRNESVICLNYTSGTTGFSKGVMLTANNYAGNILFAQGLNLLFRGDKSVAFLPMAHAYGCAFDFLAGLSMGVHIHLLGKNLSAKTLLKAFQKVKPNLIVTVPLILEKIYQKRIQPIISKPAFNALLKIPLLKRVVYAKIRKTLVAAFGGNFREVVVGGAALSKEAEDFLYKIKFPFTVGYGMTECAPLISYDNHHDFIPTSCGKIMEGFMEARIDSDYPQTIAGEIQVTGENVMMGYYKNPEATAAAFTEDGWLRTGDLGVMDKNNRLYIKGRIKTMLLGANGQNIYPEEIETRLNNMPYIAESLIIKRNNRLVGLVYPDFDEMEEKKVTLKDLEKIMNRNRLEVNTKLAIYEQIGYIELRNEEFEKTPKRSIKRYLYVGDNNNVGI